MCLPTFFGPAGRVDGIRDVSGRINTHDSSQENVCVLYCMKWVRLPCVRECGTNNGRLGVGMCYGRPTQLPSRNAEVAIQLA